MKQNIDDAMLDRGQSSEAYDIENKRPSPQGNDVPVSTAGRAKILASLEGTRKTATRTRPPRSKLPVNPSAFFLICRASGSGAWRCSFTN